MKSCLLTDIANLVRIIWSRRNISTVVVMKEKIYLPLISVEHHACLTHVRIRLDAMKHRKRDQPRPLIDQIRPSPQVNVSCSHSPYLATVLQ